MELKRIAIIGTGSLASLFAARLSSLAEIWMLGTWEAQLAAVKNGLNWVDIHGNERIVPINATQNPADIGPCDGILVLVKSYQTERSAKTLKPLLSPHTSILTLQNGVGNREILAEYAPQNACLVGITTQAANLVEPGKVLDTGAGQILIGKQEPYSGAWENLLQSANWDAQVTENVEGLLWGKLVVNTAINALATLMDYQNGTLLHFQGTTALMQSIALETAKVAHALGISLPFADPQAEVFRVAEASASNYCSMHRDISQHRPTENEAIYGAVVRAGEKVGVPTPLNSRAYELVKELEAGRLRPNHNSSLHALFPYYG